LKGHDFSRAAKADLIPEDLDYDPKSSQFFVTSVLQKEILTFDMKGTSQIFAHAPDEWPMMALKIDTQRRILWATEVALKGYKWSADAAWGRSVLLRPGFGQTSSSRRGEH